jgi:pimeloyl-ACP methyl ester carboxylesterase
MLKPELRNLVVVLPGISGSALRDREGRDVWQASHRALWYGLSSRGETVQQLRLRGTDPGTPVHPDGTCAVDLIMDAHLILGLVRVDGYTDLVWAISETFESVTECLPGDGVAGNLLKFPYDWRRDNKFSALNLREAIDDKLEAWRKESHHSDAKAILIGHSMGGLVARYYLEVLGGWEKCLALIALATPHRGSLNALDSLVNGYKTVRLDMTDALRSFPSVYQLLPVYECLFDGIADRYVADCLALPELGGGLNPDLVANAGEFHRKIREAVRRNDAIAGPDRYLTVPVVGVRQPTNQRAILRGGKLVVVKDQRPAKVAAEYDGGDGTVPLAAAIPHEHSDVFRGVMAAERHGTVQKNPFVLDDLVWRLKLLQAGGLAEVRGRLSDRTLGEMSLDLEEGYVGGEEVVLRAKSGQGDGVLLTGLLTAVETGEMRPVHFHPVATGWSEANVGPLPAGTYRIEVSTPASPGVSDLFVVTGS